MPNLQQYKCWHEKHSACGDLQFAKSLTEFVNQDHWWEATTNPSISLAQHGKLQSCLALDNERRGSWRVLDQQLVHNRTGKLYCSDFYDFMSKSKKAIETSGRTWSPLHEHKWAFSYIAQEHTESYLVKSFSHFVKHVMTGVIYSRPDQQAFGKLKLKLHESALWFSGLCSSSHFRASNWTVGCLTRKSGECSTMILPHGATISILHTCWLYL